MFVEDVAYSFAEGCSRLKLSCSVLWLEIMLVSSSPLIHYMHLVVVEVMCEHVVKFLFV